MCPARIIKHQNIDFLPATSHFLSRDVRRIYNSLGFDPADQILCLLWPDSAMVKPKQIVGPLQPGDAHPSKSGVSNGYRQVGSGQCSQFWALFWNPIPPPKEWARIPSHRGNDWSGRWNPPKI